MHTLTKSENSDEMPQNAIKDLKDLQSKKYLFGNDNLWPLDVYNGPSQVYCFKPEGKIHKCTKGLKCQWLLI